MTVAPAAESSAPAASPRKPEAATQSLAAPVPDVETVSQSAKDSVAEPAAPQSLPAAIGRFQIRRFLGEGAFGAVYEGFDPQLDRAVAIKVAKLGRGDSAQRVKRFLREAKAAAGLRHPHIVPVYDFGQEEEHFYIVSAFIPGKTLADDLKDRKYVDLEQAVRIVRQAAEALGYAHGQGIVHRDVKPANTMIDEEGQPLVMDFGLATRVEDAEKLTHAGQVLGTPRYMAPEQAKGATGSALPASDQYSLGVMLFEMITGEPPFRGTVELVMFHQVETDPPRPSKLNSAIPLDLETICLKCLEKKPENRYSSCQALADDLRRWQEGEPIHARRIGSLERAVRWSKKNPVAAASIGSVALILVLSTLVGWYLASWALNEATLADISKTAAENARKAAEDQKSVADLARKDSEIALKQAKKELFRFESMHYIDTIAAAEKSLRNYDVVATSKFLDECPEKLRNLEHAYLRKQIERVSRRLPAGHTDQISCLAFDAQGSRLASGSSDKSIRIWDLSTNQEVLQLSGHDAPVTSVVWAADGTHLYSASLDRTIKVWDLTTGKESLTLKGHAAGVTSLALFADG